jgi:hypothetical protein
MEQVPESSSRMEQVSEPATDSSLEGEHAVQQYLTGAYYNMIDAQHNSIKSM